MLNPDGKLVRFLTRMCDLLFLNLAFLVSCLTIVFSGAAVTALYSSVFEMRREKDSPSIKKFFRTVREEFALSALPTMLLFADAALIALLYCALYADVLLFSPVVFVFLAIIAALLTAVLSYLFPLLARYENAVPRHLLNAALLAVANLPVTFLLAVVNLLPILAAVFLRENCGPVLAAWLLIGAAAGAYLNSFYLSRIFKLQGGSKSDE